MKNNHTPSFIAISLIIHFILTSGLGFCDDIVIITHKTNPESFLSKNDIRDIFLGDKTQWGNRGKIKFAILRKGSTHHLFLEKYVHKTDKNYVRYWKRMIVTGKGKMPKLLSDENAILAFVASTEGAIGYISVPFLNDTVKSIKIK